MPKAKSPAKTKETTKTAAKPAAKAAKAPKAATKTAAKATKTTKTTKASKAKAAAEEVVLEAPVIEAEAPEETPVVEVSVDETPSPAEGAQPTEPSVWTLLVERLPGEVIARTWDFLVRTAPTREVWAWLGRGGRGPTRTRIAKGFQNTANSLRLPAVRNRLLSEMGQSPELTAEILQIWASATPAPATVTLVAELAEDDALTAQLPDITRRYGVEAVLLALLSARRHGPMSVWSKQIADGELSLEAAPEEAPPESDAVPAAVLAKLEAAQAETEKWQKRAAEADRKAREAQSALIAARDGFAREAHELRAQLKQEENRYSKEHEKLEEDERLLDRTTRKLKSAEKQLEELETDNKKLKKQVRQQQEVSEELQKQVAGLKAQIEELESALEAQRASAPVAPPQEPTRTDPSGHLRAPAGPLPAVMVPTSRTLSTSPLDQVFEWNADGRAIRVTPREIKRAIDGNHEGWIFALIQALDALRHNSPEGYRLLTERIRELDPYYHRVLTARTTRVLVDASNVARYEKNRQGKGQMRFLLLMRDELRKRGCFPIRFIGDASLPYNVDGPDELAAMAKRGELELTVAGQEADEVLAREARRTGAFVVTNDRTFHLKTSPNFEPPRLSFQFYDKFLVMDEF